MAELLEKLLGATIAVFMAGSLLEMGLKLDLKQAGHAFRDVRFMVTALFWSFAIGPALAMLLAKGLPLAEPYALGLILLDLAPCAPFVPLLAEKGGADLNYVAAYLLLASLGTLIILPIMIPILAPKLTAGSWTIARPLLSFIALPLAIGICVGLATSALADKSHPIVKKGTRLDIILMLGIVLLLYWRDFLSAVEPMRSVLRSCAIVCSPWPPIALGSASRTRKGAPSCLVSAPVTLATPSHRCCRFPASTSARP
jgi:bile acid:Na+ symporter, BASS family